MMKNIFLIKIPHCKDGKLFVILSTYYGENLKMEHLNELVSIDLVDQLVDHALFETMSILDENGDFLFANRNASINMTGLNPPENITGKNITEFLKEDEAANLINMYKRVIQNGETIDQQVEITTGAGVKWFKNTLRPIEVGKEQKRCVLSVSMDITEQKKREHEIASSELNYRNLVDGLVDAVAIVQNRVVKLVNPAMLSMLNYRKEEMIGHDFSDFLPTQELDKVIYYSRLAIKGEPIK